MTPLLLLNTGIVPALTELAKLGIPDTPDARRFLLANALQESNISARRQKDAQGVENGPASSFWQFEQGGGCKGVLTHPSAAERMRTMCLALNVTPTPAALWEAMRFNDVIAAVAARLLVYTLPCALPQTAQAGWLQYTQCWRPGTPRPEKWAANWKLASLTVENK